MRIGPLFIGFWDFDQEFAISVRLPRWLTKCRYKRLLVKDIKRQNGLQ